MKFHSLCFSVMVMIMAPLQAMAAKWDLADNRVGGALIYLEKTRDDKFEGTKLVAEGQYVLKRKAGEVSEARACCSMPSRPENFYGLIDAQLQVGLDGTGLEVARLGFTPWGIVWEPAKESTGKRRARRDIAELGALRWVKDDPLEVDSYLEFTIGRAGRIGTLKWSNSSPFTLRLGVQVSGGWAWAESADPVYSKVSNPFAGIFIAFALEHERFGKLYTDNRFVNGFSFSSPERGHPTVREAAVRFGYRKWFANCLSMDLFIEKRSFNFEEGGLSGRYTKSGAAGGQVNCHW